MEIADDDFGLRASFSRVFLTKDDSFEVNDHGLVGLHDANVITNIC